MTRFTRILEWLPSLTNEERQQIYTRLSFMLKLDNTMFVLDDQPNGDEALILDCLVEHLRSSGIEFASIPLLRRQTGYAAFRDKVPGVVRFLNQSKLSRQDLRAFMHFAIELLIEDLQAMNMATGARNIMNHVHRIPSVVNRQFPRYAQSGLLSMLIKRKA